MIVAKPFIVLVLLMALRGAALADDDDTTRDEMPLWERDAIERRDPLAGDGIELDDDAEGDDDESLPADERVEEDDVPDTEDDVDGPGHALEDAAHADEPSDTDDASDGDESNVPSPLQHGAGSAMDVEKNLGTRSAVPPHGRAPTTHRPNATGKETVHRARPPKP